MPLAPVTRILVVLLAFGVGSCDDPSVSTMRGGTSSPTTPTTPDSTVNLTGNWAGTATDSLGAVQMAWQLTQTGASVTGTILATNNVGADRYTGSVSGTLGASSLTFTMTAPVGRIVDLPDCSLALNGSATDVQPTSLSGTYTGNHSCLGAVEGGRIILVKQ